MTHPPTRPWFTLTLTALATFGAIVASAPAPAHDWPSPPVRPPLPVADDAQVGGWPGMVWAGPHQGAPAAPSARDCRRPPARFSLPASDDLRPQWSWRGRALPSLPGDARDATRAAAPAAGRAAAPSTGPSPETGIEHVERSERADKAVSGGLAATAPAGASAEAMLLPGARSAEREHRQRPADEPVTAGVVDDNADFGEYLAFRQRWARVPRRDLVVEQRVLLDVRDAQGRAVPDAEVRVFAQGRQMPLWARTDAGGRAWLMPQPDMRGSRFEVQVRKGRAAASVQWKRGQRDALQVRLDGVGPELARLDIVFAIDATGSMADEIDKLETSMRAVADQIARLPSRPDLCFGLVAYRDRGDEFFVRGADLTDDLGTFQSVLAQLRADAGGDYPEAMNEALHTAIHRLSWRGEGTARMVILLADAPPHLDYGAPHYDDDLRGAQARGIKVFGVGASGLDRQGELVMRQMAQFTGGRFVFLTYADRRNPASGPGRETTHDVRQYSVETLDKLLVRLVSEELARWPAVGGQ